MPQNKKAHVQKNPKSKNKERLLMKLEKQALVLPVTYQSQ